MRADLEGVKHDVHTQEIQLNILDGKLLNHEDSLASMKRDTLETHSTKLEKTETYLHKIEKKLSAIETKANHLEERIEKLLYNWDEMRKALSQSKTKMGDIEQGVIAHTKALEELTTLKKDLKKLSLLVRDPLPKYMLETYRVRKGDTLGDIAKARSVNIDTLMQINHLETETISPGQSLLVPVAPPKTEESSQGS